METLLSNIITIFTSAETIIKEKTFNEFNHFRLVIYVSWLKAFFSITSKGAANVIKS